MIAVSLLLFYGYILEIKRGESYEYTPGPETTSYFYAMLKLDAVLFTILFAGVPLLLFSAHKNLSKVRVYRDLDIDGVSEVLVKLLSETHKVNLSEIREQLGSNRYDRILQGLKHVDGIMFLRKEPEGITLRESLRDKLEACTDGF